MDREETEGRGAPVVGVVFLFFGIVLLLSTTGYLPWEIWNNLWRYWPVLIIIAGLNILLRSVNPWIVSLIVLAILIACLFIAARQSGISLIEGSVFMPVGDIPSPASVLAARSIRTVQYITAFSIL